MVEIDVKTKDGLHKVYAKEGQSLLTVLQEASLFIQAPCNGRGTCKKCRIRVNKEREALACQTYATKGMSIEILAENDKMEVLDDFLLKEDTKKTATRDTKTYDIIIDLGTTTIVLQLLMLDERGEVVVLQSRKEMNAQTVYGADVISRITASNQGKRESLSKCIWTQLYENINHMCQNNNLSFEDIHEIIVAGNTTMAHLLLAYDVHGLGKYPFHPVCLDWDYHKVSEFVKEDTSMEVTIFPGISAFVGGDIVAGLYALDFHQKEEIHLFLDLGTNGELAIGNKERILVTSTAAGPAFEGGNISCGIGSVAGAIKEVTIKKRYVSYHTIDNRAPIGICGTGVIELLAELYEKGYIDSYGSYKEEYREDGFLVVPKGYGMEHEIRFTQEDIRQMQLAKAAIRAGIEFLLDAYGVTYEEISNLYIAGGMGFSLNLTKACQIGLIPKQLEKKVIVVGNSCLGGTKKYVCNQDRAKEEIKQIRDITKHVQLAKEEIFSKYYLESMNFDSALFARKVASQFPSK